MRCIESSRLVKQEDLHVSAATLRRRSAELIRIRIISPHSVASVSVFVEDLVRDKCDERLLPVRAATSTTFS